MMSLLNFVILDKSATQETTYSTVSYPLREETVPRSTNTEGAIPNTFGAPSNTTIKLKAIIIHGT